MTYTKEKRNATVRRERQINKEKYLWTLAKQRAKKNNIPFNIEISDVTIPEVCPVLGLKLGKENSKLQDNSPTIDRVIPEKGYVKGNINVISWRANTLKRDASLDDIEKVLRYYYLHHPDYRNQAGVKKGKRPSKFYTYNGKSQGILDWARETGINESTLNNRLNRLGWDIERSLTTPVKRGKEN